MEKNSKKLIAASLGIVLGIALSGCQNPFLQLGKESIASSGSSPAGLALGNVYTVSFVSNGGTAVEALSVSPGGKISAPSAAREHFDLSGWYKEPGLSSKWKFASDTVNSDVTLYAGWEFDGNQGDGSLMYPFLVYDVLTLKTVGKEAIGATAWDLNKHYLQIDDIDMGNEDNWIPIGGGKFNAFKGSYNGGGRTIANLKCIYPAPGTEYTGLFSYLGANSVAKNVVLMDAEIEGYTYVGGIAGRNDTGTIQNCFFKGSVSGTNNIGGIVGNNYNAFTGGVYNCCAIGEITGTTDIGGVVGGNSGTVKNCYSSGSSVHGNSRVGGVVGSNSYEVLNCYATGKISGIEYIGGISGESELGKDMNCVALNTSIDSTLPTNVGRIAGNLMAGYASNNYAWSGIPVNGNDTVTGSTIDKNGQNISKTDYNSIEWWIDDTNWSTSMARSNYAEKWDFDDVWEWDSVKKLPVLQNVGGQ